MIDWLAMIVATVASTISGSEQKGWAEPVEDVVRDRRAFQNQGRLAGVVQDEAREDHCRPGKPDRPGAEMAHVGVKRLRSGDAQKYRLRAPENRSLPPESR